MGQSDKSFDEVKKKLEANKKALEKTKSLIGDLQNKEKKTGQSAVKPKK